jgi:hypothetical protein
MRPTSQQALSYLGLESREMLKAKLQANMDAEQNGKATLALWATPSKKYAGVKKTAAAGTESDTHPPTPVTTLDPSTPHQQDTESHASVEEAPPAVSRQAVLVAGYPASTPNCFSQVLVPR